VDGAPRGNGDTCSAGQVRPGVRPHRVMCTTLPPRRIAKGISVVSPDLMRPVGCPFLPTPRPMAKEMKGPCWLGTSPLGFCVWPYVEQ
jgi:hypothetical protein